MKGGVRAHAREASFREGSKVGKLRSEEEEEGGGRGSRWQQVARWPGTNVPDLLHLPTGVVDDVVCPGNDVPPVPFRNKPSVVTVPVYGVNGQGILAVMGQGVSIILRPGPSLSLFLYLSPFSFAYPILSTPTFSFLLFLSPFLLREISLLFANFLSLDPVMCVGKWRTEYRNNNNRGGSAF